MQLNPKTENLKPSSLLWMLQHIQRRGKLTVVDRVLLSSACPPQFLSNKRLSLRRSFWIISQRHFEMTEIVPKIPIETAVLKDTLRRGLASSASRSYWWPYLPNLPAGDTVSSYPNIVENAERLAVILGDVASIPHDATKIKEKEMVMASSASLLQVLVRSKIVAPEETTNVDVLVRIFVHTLKRADLTCMLAGDLLSNREK